MKPLLATTPREFASCCSAMSQHVESVHEFRGKSEERRIGQRAMRAINVVLAAAGTGDCHSPQCQARDFILTAVRRSTHSGDGHSVRTTSRRPSARGLIS
jgi:hypothetical protein